MMLWSHFTIVQSLHSVTSLAIFPLDCAAIILARSRSDEEKRIVVGQDSEYNEVSSSCV